MEAAAIGTPLACRLRFRRRHGVGQIVHAQRPASRAQFIQHDQASRTWVVGHPESPHCRCHPGIQHEPRVGRCRQIGRGPDAAAVADHEPGVRRHRPIPHQLVHIERTAQPGPRQGDAEQPACFGGRRGAQHSAGRQFLARSHPSGQLASAGQGRAFQCGDGEIGRDNRRRWGNHVRRLPARVLSRRQPP